MTPTEQIPVLCGRATVPWLIARRPGLSRASSTMSRHQGMSRVRMVRCVGPPRGPRPGRADLVRNAASSIQGLTQVVARKQEAKPSPRRRAGRGSRPVSKVWGDLDVRHDPLLVGLDPRPEAPSFASEELELAPEPFGARQADLRPGLLTRSQVPRANAAPRPERPVRHGGVRPHGQRRAAATAGSSTPTAWPHWFRGVPFEGVAGRPGKASTPLGRTPRPPTLAQLGQAAESAGPGCALPQAGRE
jgi:hypothetical protein